MAVLLSAGQSFKTCSEHIAALSAHKRCQGGEQSTMKVVLYFAVDGGSEDVCCGRISPHSATTIKEIPISAPQGQGPFWLTSNSLVGIQPERPTTRRGRAEILAAVTPGLLNCDRLNHDSRNRVAEACPMP